MTSCNAECGTSACSISEIARDIDDSELDGDLLDEWDQLTQRERAIELCISNVEDEIFEKYPDLEMAVIVLGDIGEINDRTSLRRRACLLRMEERMINMVETAKLEFNCKQWILKMKLDEIKERIEDIEEEIKQQVREKRAAKEEDNSREKMDYIDL